MAGRTHAEDCVIERRLRPIYEWLDSGTNKKAVQEADKVLRKQPSLHCARVLKGLALLRMGRREECLALVGQVVKEAPSDETTLQALTICYREMHQPEQICRVYEVAVKSEPGNEELLSHLFMSYVRVGDYKNQQHTAMKLYKLRPKNPYYFWAVMSHVMQAHKSVDPKGKEVSLLLAERMVNNFVKNGKIEAEAEVMTYLHILETQGKYVEALAVLDGPLAAKVIHQPENFLALHRGKYHTRLGQFAAAAAVYRDLIQREPDNWQHYIEYINSIIRTTTTTTTAADDPLVEASRFLTGVQGKAVEENSKDRGPLLGLLQLARVLKDAGKEERIEELCGDPSDLLLTYIKVYGDKMCCYGDVVNFLPLIGEERATGLLERVRNLSRVTSAGIPIDVEAVHRDLCWHQLRRALGQQEALTAEQHQSFANTLVHRYTATQNLAANMADTDIRPEDAYLILAAHSYLKAIQLASLSSSPPPANPGEGEAGDGAGGMQGESVHPPTLIFRLAAILERGIERTKANFQLKLLLIKVYNMLGATGAAWSVYERCDMKHIQLDTMGHVLALQALDTASYTTANAIFSSTLKFFMANYKDTSDPLIASYKYGSLTRIPEFVEFRERLSNSLHFATVTAEHMLFDLTTGVNSHSQVLEAVQQMDINPGTDRTDWDNLRDNRDLRVMNTWDPPHSCLKEEDIAASVAADTALLRLRNLTLRLVGAACTLCPPSPQNNSVAAANKENSECVNGEGGGGGGGGGDSSIYDKLTDRLQEEYQSVYESYASATPLKLPLQGPDTPRLHLYLKGSYLPLVLCHAKVLQKVYNYTLDPTGPDTKTIETVKEAREQSEQLLNYHHQFITTIQATPLDITPGTNPPALARLHHLAQAVGVAAILLGCCVVLLKPLKTQLAKRGKKRKEAVVMPEVIPQLSSYLSSFTSHLQRLEKALVTKHKQTNPYTTQDATSKISASLIGTKGLDKPGHVCGKLKESKEATESGFLQGEKQLESQSEGDKAQDAMLAGPDGLPGAEGLGDVCHKVQESVSRSLGRLACSFECKVRYLNSLKL